MTRKQTERKNWISRKLKQKKYIGGMKKEQLNELIQQKCINTTS